MWEQVNIYLKGKDRDTEGICFGECTCNSNIISLYQGTHNILQMIFPDIFCFFKRNEVLGDYIVNDTILNYNIMADQQIT